MFRTTTARPILLKNYKKPNYSVSTVDLDFQLHSTKTIVTSKVGYERAKGVKSGTSLILDGDGLTLVSIKMDGKVIDENRYIASADQLTLIDPPKQFELEIVTEVNPTANTALSGLYRSSGNYCTQCEAQGFRRITYFLDRPDVLAVYTVRLEADQSEAPLLLSNGLTKHRRTQQ